VTPGILALPLAFFFQAPPTYSIAGRLVDSVSGAPISKAAVSITGVAAPVITGKDGAFRFDGLKAGKYSLSAERIGYVTQSYGQRALHQRLSTGIAAGENQSTTNLVFRMIPGATVAGYIRDANGEPAVGMIVNLVRIIGTGKIRRIGPATAVATDDRGYYRVGSLAARNYAVIVTGSPAHELPSVEPTAYPVTFYPGTTDASRAGFISVKPGEEERGDVVLRPVRSVRIDGTIPLSPGQTLAGAYVSILTGSLFGTRIVAGESTNAAGGKFTFPSAAAGKYYLQLIQRASDNEAPRMLGAAEVDANTSPTPVSIAAGVPLRVTVHVTVTGTPKDPRSPLLATLQGIDEAKSESVAVGPDGRAVFAGTPTSGLCTLLVSQGHPLAVTSLKVTGTRQSGLVFEMTDTGSVAIEAVADATTVDVAGRLLREGMPQAGMLAIVVQRDTWEQIGIYRSDQSDSDGSFAWRDLPPGDYLGFALEDGEPNDYDDADALRALLPIAQPLTLTDAPVQKFDLKLLPMPAK
jgi:hypothetical protein